MEAAAKKAQAQQQEEQRRVAEEAAERERLAQEQKAREREAQIARMREEERLRRIQVRLFSSFLPRSWRLISIVAGGSSSRLAGAEHPHEPDAADLHP